FFSIVRPRALPTLFPYTTLFRSRSQGLGCSPIKAVRELGSERRETVRSLSVAGVGNLRGAVLSTRGPGWTHRWCTSCTARCIAGDRKSTRLNSSHVKISYAVFCL